MERRVWCAAELANASGVEIWDVTDDAGHTVIGERQASVALALGYAAAIAVARGGRVVDLDKPRTMPMLIVELPR